MIIHKELPSRSTLSLVAINFINAATWEELSEERHRALTPQFSP